MPCPQPWAQNAWKETRPRGPIAAMYASPGPAYGLPPLLGHKDHDARSGKRKEPAWSFGLKNPIKSEDISPGPAAYEPGGNTRNGPNGAPAYSMGLKLDEAKNFNNPGPGTYSPEEGSLPSGSRNPPAYSLADRTDTHKPNTYPAPNAYTLPPMLGRNVQESGKRRSPGVPLGIKHREPTYDDQPGPLNYSPTPAGVYKWKEPTYSMGGKNYPPDKQPYNVGPADYKREEVCLPYHHAAASSFGIRHSQYLGSNVVEYKPEKC